MPSIDEVIAARLKQAREALGYSQRQLAEAVAEYVDSPVWNQQRVTLLERGDTTMRARELAAVAEVLEVTPTWLCTREGGGPVRLGEHVVNQTAAPADIYVAESLEVSRLMAQNAAHHARVMRSVADRARRMREAAEHLLTQTIKTLPAAVQVVRSEASALGRVQGEIEASVDPESQAERVNDAIEATLRRHEKDSPSTDG